MREINFLTGIDLLILRYLVTGGRYKPGTTHNTEHVFSLMVESKVEIEISPREHYPIVGSIVKALSIKFLMDKCDSVKELPSYHMLV